MAQVAQNTVTPANTSGGGSSAAVPQEIDRWNWGAFLLNWIWGIGNGVYLALLMFVPLVNVVMWFVLGAKGSRWAWQKRKWDSVEHFKRVQRQWAVWAVVVYALVFLLVGAIAVTIPLMMKRSAAYQLAFAELQAHGEAMALLGTPVTSGFVRGNIQVSGPSGEARLSFPVAGTRTSGRVHVYAQKRFDRWRIDEMLIEIEGGERFYLKAQAQP